MFQVELKRGSVRSVSHTGPCALQERYMQDKLGHLIDNSLKLPAILYYSPNNILDSCKIWFFNAAMEKHHSHSSDGLILHTIHLSQKTGQKNSALNFWDIPSHIRHLLRRKTDKPRRVSLNNCSAFIV